MNCMSKNYISKIIYQKNIYQIMLNLKKDNY